MVYYSSVRFQEQYQKSLKTVAEMKVGFRSSNSGSSPHQESLTDGYEQDQDNLRTPGMCILLQAYSASMSRRFSTTC